MGKRCVLALLPLILFANCMTVRRSPGAISELSDQTMPFTREADIFTEALWLTPPINGKKLEFIDGRASVAFAGTSVSFEKMPGRGMAMTRDGSTIVASAIAMKGDHYYNLEAIPWKTVYVSRHVSKTEWVTENVQVRKSRLRTEQVMVRKPRTVYDPFTKRSKTEYYSEWETRTVTEWYDDTEQRRVLKTSWSWEKVPERTLDIPEYSAYRFSGGKGGDILVYVEAALDGENYYVQNAGYYAASVKMPGPGGKDVPVRMMLIDTDQNGIYGDPEDQVLFNTWNPYDRDSSFRGIHRYMDNQWMRLSWLAEEAQLMIAVDEAASRISWKNANADYIMDKAKGKIRITGLPSDAALSINGEEYRARRGEFSSSIEYGYYKAVIRQPGHFDQVFRFAVTAQTPEFNGVFSEQPAAATVTVANHDFRNWKLSALDQSGKEWTVFDVDDISLPDGTYKIILSGGGAAFVKEATVKAGERWIYDFTADTLTLKPSAPMKPARE